MEQLNRIELRGNVGSVKVSTFENRQVARLTLATNYAYKDRTGSAVIDTTWFNVTLWSGHGVDDLNTIVKGSKMYVTGRVRMTTFKGSDELDHTVMEVLANRAQLLEGDDQLQCEF